MHCLGQMQGLLQGPNQGLLPLQAKGPEAPVPRAGSKELGQPHGRG